MKRWSIGAGLGLLILIASFTGAFATRLLDRSRNEGVAAPATTAPSTAPAEPPTFRWAVTVTNQESGAQNTLVVDAESAYEARQLVENRPMFDASRQYVTRVERMSDALPAASTQPSAETTNLCDQPGFCGDDGEGMP
jgi:hypothetical protein